MNSIPLAHEFDVIIVGAGPAGLSCASELANSKLKVLLFDKKEKTGDKACAGGITRLAGSFSLPAKMSRSFSKQIIYLTS